VLAKQKEAGWIIHPASEIERRVHAAITGGAKSDR
jgi:hypothetical protein